MKLINQYVIKNNNLKKIYECVCTGTEVSRAGIAKQLSLSKTTVSALTEELIREGFVEDVGQLNGNASVGRNPCYLHPKHNCHYIAVAEWKQQSVEMRLVDINGGYELDKTKLHADSTECYASLTILCYEHLIKALTKETRISGVCIILPGLIDQKRQSLISTPLQIDWEVGGRLIEQLKSGFLHENLCILNDTACLSYAEIKSKGLKNTDFAYINFATGIGAALYMQERILGGATGSNTQFGHCCIDPDGLDCYCGAKGCLEAMIGESALPLRWGKEILDSAGNETGNSLNYSLLCKLAESGNENAVSALQNVADGFSLAAVDLITLVHPQRIIIGGKGIELGNLFLRRVKNNLKHMGLRYMVENVTVSFSTLSSDAAYYGAALYYFDTYYDFTAENSNGFYLG